MSTGTGPSYFKALAPDGLAAGSHLKYDSSAPSGYVEWVNNAILVRKSGTSQTTSSSGIQDAHLLFQATAGSSYFIQMNFRVTGPGTGGIYFGIFGPSGTTLQGGVFGATSSGNGTPGLLTLTGTGLNTGKIFAPNSNSWISISFAADVTNNGACGLFFAPSTNGQTATINYPGALFGWKF